MATEGEKIEALSGFLRESFGLRDLERFLVVKGYGEVADALDQAAGMAPYSFNVVRELRRRGLIDIRFFDLLKNERPAKEERIKGLEAIWLAEDRTRSKRSRISEAGAEATEWTDRPQRQDVEASESSRKVDRRPARPPAEERRSPAATPRREFAPREADRPRLDPRAVEQAAKALAEYLGPMAYVLARQSARKARSIRQLYEALAAEFPTGADRGAFLACRPC
jgi:hypothetical protein